MKLACHVVNLNITIVLCRHSKYRQALTDQKPKKELKTGDINHQCPCAVNVVRHYECSTPCKLCKDSLTGTGHDAMVFTKCLSFLNFPIAKGGTKTIAHLSIGCQIGK